MDGKLRQQLIAEGRPLRALISISAGDVSEGAIAHVRTHLEHHELAKVRVRADSHEECEQAAAELAERVPCEIVNRVGRVILIHRAQGEQSE